MMTIKNDDVTEDLNSFVIDHLIDIWMVEDININDLIEEIEEKRDEMFELAYKNGFTSEITVACSQQLDHLLNLLDKKTSL